MKSHENELIYLIVSGPLAKEIDPEIYSSSNLVKIFLLCGSITAYSQWALENYNKILIFNHEDDLLER